MKNKSLKLIICLAFLILFNVLFFCLGGTEHSLSVWSGYGFIHVAYICLLSTPLLYQKKKGLTILPASLYLRALVYFLVQLGVGSICILLDFTNPAIPIAIQSILFFVFLVLQLMSVLANDATEKSIQKQHQESIKLQLLTQQLKSCMRQLQDSDMKKQVLRCYESLVNCPIECFPETIEVEQELATAVETLSELVSTGNMTLLPEQVKSIIQLVQKRNSIIILLRK